MKNTLVHFLETIQDYERESGNSIFDYDREPSEIVDIYLDENKELKDLSIAKPPPVIHTTIGVYVGTPERYHWKWNGVTEENLKRHILYNKVNRVGRGLFVDGVCVYKGSLSPEQIVEVEMSLKMSPQIMIYDTQPYH